MDTGNRWDFPALPVFGPFEPKAPPPPLLPPTAGLFGPAAYPGPPPGSVRHQLIVAGALKWVPGPPAADLPLPRFAAASGAQGVAASGAQGTPWEASSESAASEASSESAGPQLSPVVDLRWQLLVLKALIRRPAVLALIRRIEEVLLVLAREASRQKALLCQGG